MILLGGLHHYDLRFICRQDVQHRFLGLILLLSLVLLLLQSEHLPEFVSHLSFRIGLHQFEEMLLISLEERQQKLVTFLQVFDEVPLVIYFVQIGRVLQEQFFVGVLTNWTGEGQTGRQGAQRLVQAEVDAEAVHALASYEPDEVHVSDQVLTAQFRDHAIGAELLLAAAA